MGTIPQWICALASIAILAVLGTHWSGITPEWVSAVATVVLAFSAVAGLLGVLVPLKLERQRRRTEHLDKLVAVVLRPMRLELESFYEPRVLRKYTPICWRKNEGVCDVRIRPGIDGSYQDDLPPEDASLYKSIYSDLRENHYPQLIIDHDKFESGYVALVKTAIGEATALELKLHKSCNLNDMGVTDTNGRGVLFGHLAVYLFNRLWLADYPYKLSIRQVGANFCQLCCEADSNCYGNGTEEEMENVRRLTEELINNHTPLHSKQLADRLSPKLQALTHQIDSIRINKTLAGECEATKSRGLLG